MTRKKTQTLQLVQDATLERMTAAAVSKVGVLLPPWAVLGAEAGAAAISHAVWGGPGSVAWAAVACTASSMLLTGLTWLITHQRRLLGRIHTTATTAAATGWFTAATITGLGADATAGALFYGGGALALSWNLRTVIRRPGGEEHVDALAGLFDRAKEAAGLRGTRVRTVEVTDTKIKGRMELPPGEMTADDAIKAADRIESGMQLPPGSVVVSRDEDRADQAHISVSDPRAIRQPIPWPGPSAPGESIDKPLRIGIYQDGDPVQYRFVGHHLQIMGMTGSGKSIGGAWNIIGELITRHDVAVFSIDLAKDDQTMGPLRPALHRFESTKAGAVELIRAIHAAIPERTKWLASRGYQTWEPGCGLTYWVLHIEEAPKLINELGGDDEEKLAEIMKEIRSAGGSLLLSLQRADYTQIPTLLRSQMAKMCFGLADPDDVKYGVTSRQRKADVAPHEWADNYPGMAYLDARGIPHTHYAMPLRTYSWGATSAEANAAMRAHAAAWPAAAKQVDEFTAAIAAPDWRAPAPSEALNGAQEAEEDPPVADVLGEAAALVIATQRASTAMLQRKLRLNHATCLRVLEALERKGVVGPPHPGGTDRPVLIAADDPAAAALVEQIRQDGDPVAEALTTEDPDPSITAGPNDVIRQPTEAEAAALVAETDASTAPMPAEAARAEVAEWIRRRAAEGRPTFIASDLNEVRRRTGRTSRGWIYKVLDAMTDDGALSKDTSGPTTVYRIENVAALDQRRVPVSA